MWLNQLNEKKKQEEEELYREDLTRQLKLNDTWSNPENVKVKCMHLIK